MSKKLLITTTIIGLLALGAVSQAQNSQMSISIRALLERTDQVIDLARDIVQATDHPVGTISLQTAVDLQEQAWRHYRSGPENTHELAAAKAKTNQARELAQKIVSAGRQLEQEHNGLLQKLERTTTLVETIEELAFESGSDIRNSVVQSLRSSLNRAWEFYNAGQYRPALKLCNQVEQNTRKLANSVNSDSRQQVQFERRAEFVRKALERVRTSLGECVSEDASDFLDQAWQSYSMATHLYGQERHGAALRTLQKARKLGEQAMRRCRGGQTLEGRYEHLQNETDRLAENVSGSDSHGQKLLDLIREQLKLAADYIEDGNTASASAALRAAELTLGQLKGHLKDSGW